MDAPGLSLFDTAIGPCGIAWGSRGITGVLLPETDQGATLARLRRRFPASRLTMPPAPVAAVIADITRLLGGTPTDLLDAALDLEGIPLFERQVYAVTRTIAPGRTLTYGEIAERVGQPDAARAVGKALGRNPFPIIVPCHRVLAANGKLGGFSAPGGGNTKQRMLEIEQAKRGDEPSLFD